ncbi:MAG: hypothetical protein IKS56_01155 [Lachnospiraceae bacterium]|nr:hypothetical protein [Lachnospiraceae bacterium]
MKIYKRKTWQYETTGTEKNSVLFGVYIFEYKWRDTGERVKVKDPLYGQDYAFPVYNVTIEGIDYSFASGELSNGVYGFYVLKY